MHEITLNNFYKCVGIKCIPHNIPLLNGQIWHHDSIYIKLDRPIIKDVYAFWIKNHDWHLYLSNNLKKKEWISFLNSIGINLKVGEYLYIVSRSEFEKMELDYRTANYILASKESLWNFLSSLDNPDEELINFIISKINSSNKNVF